MSLAARKYDQAAAVQPDRFHFAVHGIRPAGAIGHHMILDQMPGIPSGASSALDGASTTQGSSSKLP
jgi:hypothetical protein